MLTIGPGASCNLASYFFGNFVSESIFMTNSFVEGNDLSSDGMLLNLGVLFLTSN